jgi:predicted phosphodiesterase
MRIFFVSDIHSEYIEQLYPGEKPLPNSQESADLVILAGDIGRVDIPGPFSDVLNHYKKMYKHVIMVPGNHEYYGANFDFDATLDRTRKFVEKHGVIFLCRDTVNIDGITFVGATLWSDVSDKDFALMNDSRYIFRLPENYRSEHQKDVLWLENTLKDVKTPTVVITHHLPTKKLVHKKFYSYPGGSGFYTEISHLAGPNVKLWVCGHTHERMETVVNGTTFSTNPLGYPWEKRETPVSRSTFNI